MKSPVHALDPRIKLVSALCFILMVVLTPDKGFGIFGFDLFLIGIVFAFSHVPLGYVLKRSLAIIPFAVMVALFVPFITPGQELAVFTLSGHEIAVTGPGVERFFAICCRAYLSFFAVILMVATTRFGDLMWAAGELHMPVKLVQVVSFMYRYLFVLVDDVSHMILARDLRSGRRRRMLLTASAGIIGAMFLRSFEHAERLYEAMLLRGFAGRTHVLNHKHVNKLDVIVSTGFITAAVIGFVFGRVHFG